MWEGVWCRVGYFWLFISLRRPDMKDMKIAQQSFWCRWRGAVTCVCGWGRWKPFHRASWWWSCGCWRWDSCETQTRAVRYGGLEHVWVLILDVHPPCSLHLAPQKQRVLGWAFLFIVFSLYADVLDLLHTRTQHNGLVCISLTIMWWKCDAIRAEVFKQQQKSWQLF